MFSWPSMQCKSLYQILWHLLAHQGKDHLKVTPENCHVIYDMYRVESLHFPPDRSHHFLRQNPVLWEST